MKKIFAILSSIAMALSLAVVPTKAKEVTTGWVTGDNNKYGSIVQNPDGTKTFYGSETRSEDVNGYYGPYSKDDVMNIKDGDIVKSVHLQLDPATMTAGEKSGISLSVNDASGENYKTEYGVLYFGNIDGKIHFQTGYESNFGTIDRAGSYEFKFTLKDINGKLHGKFEVIDEGESVVVSTKLVDLGVGTNEVSTSRSLWFYDISDDNGVIVGEPDIPNDSTLLDASELLPEDWVFADGYGNARKLSDNIVLLTGNPIVNSDNSLCGPYVNTKGAELKHGVSIVDEVHVLIDPAGMNAGEKFSLSTNLKDENNGYVTEMLVNFFKDSDGSVGAQIGLDLEFAAKITKKEIYTLQYVFTPGDYCVFGYFNILLGDEIIASTKHPIMMPNATIENVEKRGSIWFSDISVGQGLEVYTNPAADYTKVEEALTAIPSDLSGYTEESVAKLEEAKKAVNYGLTAIHQNEVNAYATAILTAIDELVEFTEWTDLEPAQPIELTLTIKGILDGEEIEDATTTVKFNKGEELTEDDLKALNEIAKEFDEDDLKFKGFFLDKEGTKELKAGEAFNEDFTIYMIWETVEPTTPTTPDTKPSQPEDGSTDTSDTFMLASFASMMLLSVAVLVVLKKKESLNK